MQALQEYLDEVKWKDSEKLCADMCGRYARCRYCTRTESYPCARAHNRLIEMQSSPVPDRIPEWLLPEPPVPEAAERASLQTAAAPAAPQDAEPVGAYGYEEGGFSLADRPHVVSCGARGDTRLCVIARKRASVGGAEETAD